MTTEVGDFRPIFWASNPHLQTLSGTFGLARPPPAQLEIVELIDGDRIALEISTPRGWRVHDPTVLLVHGLCGCSRSRYCVRLARKLLDRGARAVRMNLRGCGPGRGLARQIYHSGRSDDVLAVVKALHGRAPASPLTVVGFSLGGNIVLKLAGELGGGASGLIQRVVAVCPPTDLKTSALKLSQRRNRLYDRFFVRLLINSVIDRHALFPDLPAPRLSRRLRLVDFDDRYTAPSCGFRDAMDYYERASSAPLLGQIAVPTRILVADDDPLIDSSILERMPLPPTVRVMRTRHGGHLGFFGRDPRAGGLRWLDGLLMHWAFERD